MNSIGATLVELIVVAVIVAILATVAYATIGNLLTKAREKQEAYVIKSIQHGIEISHAAESIGR